MQNTETNRWEEIKGLFLLQLSSCPDITEKHCTSAAMQNVTHSAWTPSISSASFSRAVLLSFSLKCFRNGLSKSAKVTTSSTHGFWGG